MMLVKGLPRVIVLGLVLAASAPRAAGADFEAGVRAAKEGDYTSAYVEWLASAREGNPLARFNLGVLYDKGLGVEPDADEAFRWYLKAAEQGMSKAQYNVGVMYAKGRGTAKDNVSAYVWLTLAAQRRAGPEKAKALTLHSLVVEEMSDEQIAAARARIEDWTPAE